MSANPEEAPTASPAPQAGSPPTTSPPATSPPAAAASGIPAPVHLAGEDFEHDEAFDERDDDSAVGFDSGSTASITSSVLKYRTFHGRSYQNSNTTTWWAPNDEKHVEGFDIAHHWLTMMLGDKLFSAPIGDDPKRILDVGTGSGIWAIDVADQFPDAEVIGTDIAPTQPGWVPPNLRFEIDDAQQDWTFAPDHFDFIHARVLHGSFDDFPKFYRQMYRHLKPGGWFQHMEPDIELRPDNPDVEFGENHVYKRWADLFYKTGEKINRDFTFNDEQKMVKWARDAGFVNITARRYKVPHGTWPKDKRLKEIGAFVAMYMETSLDGLALSPAAQVLGWSYEEVVMLVAEMRAAIRDLKNRTVSNILVVYGQKPYDAVPESGNDSAAAPPATTVSS